MNETRNVPSAPDPASDKRSSRSTRRANCGCASDTRRHSRSASSPPGAAWRSHRHSCRCRSRIASCLPRLRPGGGAPGCGGGAAGAGPAGGGPNGGGWSAGGVGAGAGAPGGAGGGGGGAPGSPGGGGGGGAWPNAAAVDTSIDSKHTDAKPSLLMRPLFPFVESAIQKQLRESGEPNFGVGPVIATLRRAAEGAAPPRRPRFYHPFSPRRRSTTRVRLVVRSVRVER